VLPVEAIPSGKGVGLNDIVDLRFPLAETRVEPGPGKEGVRVILLGGRGPSGARGTSLVRFTGRGFGGPSPGPVSCVDSSGAVGVGVGSDRE
jgi:hypothetical protein